MKYEVWFQGHYSNYHVGTYRYRWTARLYIWWCEMSFSKSRFYIRPVAK